VVTGAKFSPGWDDMAMRALLAVVMVAAISVSGCAASAVAGHGATGAVSSSSRPPGTTSPDGRFALTLPPGWSDNSATHPELAALYTAPVLNGFTVNVNVTEAQTAATGDLATYAQEVRGQLRGVLHITEESVLEPTHVDHEQAEQYSYKWVVSGRTLKQRQTIVIHDGRGYVFTYTALAAQYGETLAAADALMSSVQWT